MTDNEINAAIARACGWTDTHVSNGYYGANYCTDLNAMHEVEIQMSKQDENRYFHALHETGGNMYFYRATARQRAEAFLRTIGKWDATTEESSVDQSGDSTEK